MESAAATERTLLWRACCPEKGCPGGKNNAVGKAVLWGVCSGSEVENILWLGMRGGEVKADGGRWKRRKWMVTVGEGDRNR